MPPKNSKFLEKKNFEKNNFNQEINEEKLGDTNGKKIYL